MSTQRTTISTWITAGVCALPLYAMLLVVGTWSPQPDQTTNLDGWARFVASPSYLISHLATNVIGPVLVILGTYALTAAVAHRAPRLAPSGLALATTGHVLLTVPGVISTFATPAVARAYLDGNHAVMTMEFPGLMSVITMLAILFAVAGNIVLGVVIARTAVLPRWTGVLWAAGAVIFYLLGALLGMATTGAGLPTQPAGATLLTLSGAAMALAAVRRHTAGAEPIESKQISASRS